MRAKLKGLSLKPEPSELPDDPAEFSLLAQMMVGPADGPGDKIASDKDTGDKS